MKPPPKLELNIGLNGHQTYKKRFYKFDKHKYHARMQIIARKIKPIFDSRKLSMIAHENITMKKNNTTPIMKKINIILIVFFKDIKCACNINFIC